MENKERINSTAKNAYILYRKTTTPPILSFEKHILKNRRGLYLTFNKLLCFARIIASITKNGSCKYGNVYSSIAQNVSGGPSSITPLGQRWLRFWARSKDAARAESPSLPYTKTGMSRLAASLSKCELASRLRASTCTPIGMPICCCMRCSQALSSLGGRALLATSRLTLFSPAA